jgi:hypothetical protein
MFKKLNGRFPSTIHLLKNEIYPPPRGGELDYFIGIASLRQAIVRQIWQAEMLLFHP